MTRPSVRTSPVPPAGHPASLLFPLGETAGTLLAVAARATGAAPPIVTRMGGDAKAAPAAPRFAKSAAGG
ncbi:hypothetical protein [Hyphomicrobium sp. DY-1]|uniref:hypothetical protein n=1 Tax=Hyphomicrobium sp. DY-1 TaxID=3075650 RepID=UPI0039C2F671